MKPLGRQNTHVWLAQRMAQVTKTDLVLAMKKAQLNQDDWAAMVEDCRHCDWTEGCKKFLALQIDAPAQVPPDACRNQERFMALRVALEEMDT
ncbi:hypothetical protein SAMN05444000_12074 [Shimia gijangensis]|uniref:DUF6455 domain-containing protein n=1 Tax=Shimia gijangensis TaxID=1470563 RepID=A0A1M6Q8L9_9RHOB|nr:DUF6455 family protein [Shimia gijangensis]SHK16619.1 hypothetical protein SAMN05444000_12074 [Shimia gijangensis]